MTRREELKRRLTLSRTAELARHLADSELNLGIWNSGWSAERAGSPLVSPNGEIQTLLERLDVAMRLDPGGAVYDPGIDRISIPPAELFEDLPTQSATKVYYATVLHELVHWTGHPTRLDRLRSVDVAAGYAAEELIAELGAVLLMDVLDMLPRDLSSNATYFQTWLEQCADPEQAQTEAIGRALEAVQFIVDRGIL